MTHQQYRDKYPITPRQQQILDYIIGYQRIDPIGDPPTRMEICLHFGFKVNAANMCLKYLEKKGFIKLVPRRHRGIKVIPSSQLQKRTE